MAGNLLTIKQVADQLSVSVIQVRRLIKDKVLPAYRLGYRSYRIDSKDLADFKTKKRTVNSI
jgi:excisionase family DNA binding protein